MGVKQTLTGPGSWQIPFFALTGPGHVRRRAAEIQASCRQAEQGNQLESAGEAFWIRKVVAHHGKGIKDMNTIHKLGNTSRFSQGF